VNTSVPNTPQPADVTSSSERFSPLRFLIITIGGIAIAEIIAMIFVYFYRHLPYYQQVLIDATIMVLIIIPILYLLSFQPLLRHIEKRQRAEQALRQVNRALSVLNECNQILVHAEKEAEFLQKMCNIIVNTGQYRMAWIGFAEQDQARSIRPAAQFGFENGYLDLAQITWADNERGQGPTGTAIRQGVVQVNQNFLTNPAMAPWRESALSRGYQASISLPLQAESSTFGALTIYSALPDAFNEEELHLLRELANDLAFGITALRIRAERNQAEDLNRQLSRIVEQTEDTVVVTNFDGHIEYVNPAFERLTGYAREEVLNKTPRVLKSGVHDKHFYQELWNPILKGDVFQGEIANRKKSGELFYEVKTITPLRDAQGTITHFVATGKDITEHKHHEEDLLRAYSELELHVQERTQELRVANSELEIEIIERRQIEEALRASEQRLNRSQEIAHLGSWELDVVNDRLSWSDEVYRIFGLQPQEFEATYEAFLETVHPDDRAVVDDAYTGSVQDGKDGYEIEHRIIKRARGELRIVHEKCEHFRNEDGQVIRSAGMVHDITERKLAEEALRESQSRLEAIFAAIPSVVMEYDINGRAVRANEAALKILGVDSLDFTRDQAVAQLHFRNIDGSPLRMEHLPTTRALQGEMVAGDLYWIRTADAEERIISAYAAPFYKEDASVNGVVAVWHDITELKQTEEALRSARDELELRVQERTKELVKEIGEREKIERQLRIQTTAMEAAADGIVITDRSGNIQWTNPALAQISGFCPEDLIGHSTKIFNSGQHNAAYYQQMWDTILSGEVWRGEMTNRRKDGSLYIEEQTITPVRGNDSEITQFIAIKQDITERKQAEREITERNQKEKILTQTIHTMQLDIARDLHDTIGQNISFLRMKLDYLAEKKTRKKAEMQLELSNMARAANESYDLMRGTLAVLQSETSADLFHLFTRYAEHIEERSSFEIDFSSQGEPRFMSAKRMRQLFYIFREILNNIEKHANASQVSMAMTWASEGLNLVIIDDGLGFDLDKVQYGSHYGLRFMRERAELLSGSMIIRSEVGSGTKIVLQVPYE
jgi:PAS domain S-box-containing protein